MQSVTAQAIFDCLHDVLILMGKDWHSVLSVCFDGASTMAGKIGGVQTKCKEQNSDIKYIHCYAHCLNLALVDSVCDKSKNSKRNKLVLNYFGTLLDELISGINSRFNQEIMQLVQAVASMIRLDSTPGGRQPFLPRGPYFFSIVHQGPH